MAGHPPKGSSVQTQPSRQDGRGFFHVKIPHFICSRYCMIWLDLKIWVPKGVGSNNFILSQFIVSYHIISYDIISYHIISSCIDSSPWWPHKQSYCEVASRNKMFLFLCPSICESSLKQSLEEVDSCRRHERSRRWSKSPRTSDLVQAMGIRFSYLPKIFSP